MAGFLQYIRTYQGTCWLTSFLGGSCFGLAVASITLLLNPQIHQGANVWVLLFSLQASYGLAGLLVGGIISLFILFLFRFLTLQPTRKQLFAILVSCLSFLYVSLLLFHAFESPYYAPHAQQLKLLLFFLGEGGLIAGFPLLLTGWQKVADYAGKYPFKKQLFFLLLSYLLLPLFLTASFSSFNEQVAYAPLKSIRSSSENAPAVVLVGWDGANWFIIDKLLKKGLLPNLQRMIDQGVSGRIKSDFPLTSIALWNTIITGKTTKQHGITDYSSTYIPFTSITLEELRLPAKVGLDKIYKRFHFTSRKTSSRLRKVPTLWEILSIAGETVGSVGWYASFPTTPVNGFLVSDQYADRRLARSVTTTELKQAYIYPADYYDTLWKYTYGLRDLQEKEINQFMTMSDEDRFLLFGRGKCAINLPIYQFAFDFLTDKSHAQLSTRLYQQFKPDFLSVYLGGLDTCQHFYWQYFQPNQFEVDNQEAIDRYRTVVPRYYQFLDKQLGELRKNLNRNTVLMLLSDHGLVSAPGKDAILGGHSAYGIFVCSGAGIPAQKHIQATIYDIVPTVLKLRGLPLAEDMKGKPIPALFPLSETAQPQKERFIPSYNYLLSAVKRDRKREQVINQSIDKRLQRMGYLPQ